MKKHPTLFLLFLIFGVHCQNIQSLAKGDKSMAFSKSVQDCSKKQSNDCLISDATIIEDKEIKLLWQNISVAVSSLPQNSWYKVNQSTSDDYELTVYPNVGDHYMLGSHDFEVIIRVKKTTRPATDLSCTSVNVSDDFGDKQYQNGPFDIQVLQRINYFHDGGPGSNPNPFTGEVKDILKKVMNTIRIGKC